MSEYVVEGTDTDNLRKGPGHYPDTPLPGQRGTRRSPGTGPPTARPSATSTSSTRGDRIVLEMPYGTFVYRVDAHPIVDDSALWVTKRVGHDQLVLTRLSPALLARRSASWRSPRLTGTTASQDG